MNRRWMAPYLWMVLFLGGITPSAHATDFKQMYEHGKLLLRQKLYVDAVKKLYQATYGTARGKTHFGAHYYLSIAYYRLGNITRAMETLNQSKALIKNKQQRASMDLLQQRILNLFGELRIIPEVNPDRVGRLRLELDTKNEFSHPQKIRSYRIIRKFWTTKGIVLKGARLYLPKGEYRISIVSPQCLRYGLTLGGGVMQEITIGDQPSSLALREKQSCQCPGGQVLQKQAGKLSCECPKGTLWSSNQKRCEIPTKPGQDTWIAKNWVWVTVLGVGVVGGAAAAISIAVVSANADYNVAVGGQLFRNTPK